MLCKTLNIFYTKKENIQRKKFEVNIISSFIIFDLSYTFFVVQIKSRKFVSFFKNIFLKKVLFKSKITTKQILDGSCQYRQDGRTMINMAILTMQFTILYMIQVSSRVKQSSVKSRDGHHFLNKQLFQMIFGKKTLNFFK